MEIAIKMSHTDNVTQQFYNGPKNSSYIIPGVYDLSTEDTNWVLTSSFIIFTMVFDLIFLLSSK